MYDTITRRKLLAAVSGGVLATTGGMDPRSIGPEQSAAARSDGDEFDLRVRWRRTYNGRIVDDGSGTGITAGSPASAGRGDDAPIAIDDVAPGDTGSLRFDLRATGASQRVRFRLELSPEYRDRTDVDRSGTNTTLSEVVEVALLAGDTGSAGGCDRFSADATERVVRGTLASIDRSPPRGIELPLSRGGCLEPGNAECVELRWWISDAVGNEIQSNAVAFSVTFAATACETDSDHDDSGPFAGVESIRPRTGVS